MKNRLAAVPFVVAAFAYACADAPVAPRPVGTPQAAQAGMASVYFASTARQIATNTYFHACALDSLRKAWCWGDGRYSALGHDTTKTNRPVKVRGDREYLAISAGLYHNCAIALNGAAWCWGYNGDKELGGGVTVDSSSLPVLVPGGYAFSQISTGGQHTCGISGTGLLCWGTNYWSELGDSGVEGTHGIEQIGNGRSWLMVSAGDFHTCGLTSDSLTFCWGRNNRGQLGTGDIDSRNYPVQTIGNRHFARIDAHLSNTCALTAAGAAWCWGDNAHGQLGIRATVPDSSLVPRLVKGAHVFIDISVGDNRVCGLTTAGIIYCWGQSTAGDNGFAAQDSMPHKVVTPAYFVSLSIGSWTSCARSTLRNFYCWGYGVSGAIGNGSYRNMTHPSVVRQLFSIY